MFAGLSVVVCTLPTTVLVMDCVQETREVIVRVPILTPVESSVVVKQLAVDLTTVPAVATTYRVVTLPSTLAHNMVGRATPNLLVA